MKRLIGGGLVLLLVAIGIFLWQQSRFSLLAGQIAPAGCLVYVELPNLDQTAKRWPDAALCRILNERSVQHFLKQPLAKGSPNYQNAWESLATLRCRSLFFGMTEPARGRWICGLQTSADQTTSRREIANLSKALFGQTVEEVDNLEHERKEGGGIGHGLAQIYCARAGSWVLLSKSTELLVEALRNSKAPGGGLQSLKLFQDCRANVPADYDLLSFVQGGPSLDPSVGLHWGFHEQRTQGNVRAVLAATTIVGARLRDTVFTLTAGPPTGRPLDRKGFAMTSPSTIGYLATQVGFSEIWRWCGQLSEQSQLAETIRKYMGQAQSFGIDPQDLDNLVSGAEVILDRDPKSDSLNAAFSLQVADPAKFQRLMEQVVAEKFPDNTKKILIDSVPAYSMEVNERVSIVFGLVGGQILVSGSQSNFGELVRRLRNQAPGLETDSQFQGITKLVGQPDDLFVYLDAKSGFERFYEASRPMLVFGILLMPTLNRYVDAMALPETEDISKHLSPIVLSRHRVANGFVDESVGPITAYDALMLLLGGAMSMGLADH
jgi:hypothetical protein